MWLLLIPVGIFLVLVLFSRLYYHRSLSATIVEWYLRATSRTLTEEELAAGLPELERLSAVEFEIPTRYAKNLRVEKHTFQGMQTFVFYGGKEDTVVLYLHGAGYVRPPRKQHWRFAYRLAKGSGATVVFALYPKAPAHTCLESYEILTALYGKLRRAFKTVVISGDSSGGGLALGLTQTIAGKGEKQPDKLILLSPWVDITLNNPQLKNYERKDPFVSIENERAWGKLWAGGLSTDDRLVSPINGEMKGLPPVTLFVGTRETLYPDVKKLEEKLKVNGVKVTTHEGVGLNHVYPIYPIPEARTALRFIINELR